MVVFSQHVEIKLPFFVIFKIIHVVTITIFFFLSNSLASQTISFHSFVQILPLRIVYNMTLHLRIFFPLGNKIVISL